MLKHHYYMNFLNYKVVSTILFDSTFNYEMSNAAARPDGRIVIAVQALRITTLLYTSTGGKNGRRNSFTVRS